MNHARPGRTATTLAAIALILAGCTAAGVPAPSASTQPSSGPSEPSADAPASAAPPSDATGGGVVVGPGAPRLVVPKPGQLEPRPIAAESFAARVDGRRVLVTVTWTSGVEPCNVLDHVEVRRDGQAFAITLFEGHGPGNQVCIMLAEQHRTEVGLSTEDLAPGTYTISDGTGTAPAIQVAVS
jgi:hypothetical protein